MPGSSTATVAITEKIDIAPIRWQRAVDDSILQNFVVIWLDSKNNELKNNCHSSIRQLQDIVNSTHLFNDVDDCIDVLTEIEGRRTFMIISNTLSQQLIPLIHDIPQLHSIYIFSYDTKIDDQRTMELSKVRGIATQILPIYNSIKRVARKCDPNPASVSFPSLDDVSTSNLHQLEQSFMYSQLLKEILLEIDFDTKKAVKYMAAWYHAECSSNPDSPKLSDNFEEDYHRQTPIWWYTSDSFIYFVLNKALRTQEMDILMWMGYFLRALHKNIEQLHLEQMNDHQMKPFTVYRGQGFMKEDFEKMIRTKGGLMSFNNFLSTSTDPDVARFFADTTSSVPDLIQIIFEMTIDTSVSSVPFANLENIGQFNETEKEILFSMHTVFRIGDIESISDDSRCWRVKLTLASNTDKELVDVTNKIREETQGGSTGLFRLGRFLINFGKYDIAKGLYETMLDLRPNDDNSNVKIYGQLGLINEYQGKNLDALALYEKIREIDERLGSPDHSETATLYNNIGKLYNSMSEYSNALLHYEKALHFEQDQSLPDQLKMAFIYGNIGVTYENMENGSKAFENCEKSLQISQKILPSCHPELARCHINIGLASQMMREYPMALSHYEKALEICKRTLPPNHPNLIPLYNNIGGVYFEMHQHSEARLSHEKALEIARICYSTNHPSLATSYHNIGLIYNEMGEYYKALEFHEQALEIRRIILPSNHSDLGFSYDSVGATYRLIGEYSKAVTCHEKALEIGHQGTPPNDLFIANCYMNIGDAYVAMADCSKALSSHEKALEIRQNILPADHPKLGLSYNNLGCVYYNMKDHSRALSCFTQAFEIYQKTLSPDHPHLTQYYNNVGILYNVTGQNAKALLYLEKALESRQRTLDPNHPELANSYHHIGVLYASIGDHSKAQLYHKKALEISQIILPPNHDKLAYLCNSIGLAYENMGDHSAALSVFQRAVDIGQQSLPSEHPNLQAYEENLKILQKRANNAS